MKTAYYIVETKYASYAGGYPEWHNNSVHNSLKAALARKAEILEIPGWRAKEIRIIECTRKVIR